VSDLERFCERARELGATDAKVIAVSTIKTGAWVWMKCRYGCASYGASLCCPPHSPRPEETQRVLDCYQRAILVHCKPRADGKDLIFNLEREVFLAGYQKAFGMGAGPCGLCDSCTMDLCRYADRARPAMEACGIDVYSTVRANGYSIRVACSVDDDHDYFGVVLVD